MQAKLLLFTFVLCGMSLVAQVETPAPSPLSKLEQRVGLTDVTIEYSRPGMKNRVIFGELVPFDEMWRVGANSSTKITFSEDVVVEGYDLEKGTYGLYSVPGELDWDFIFYKDATQWGVPKEYDRTQEVLRITVESEEIPWTMETLIIDINNIRDKSARVQVLWENTIVGFNFEVNTDEKVQASIEKTLSGPGRSDYYSAAKYYFSNNLDMDQALEWVQDANDIDSKFWQLRLESLIHAKLGDIPSAITTAKKSLVMAKAAGYDNYVRMNRASIKEWTGAPSSDGEGPPD